MPVCCLSATPIGFVIAHGDAQKKKPDQRSGFQQETPSWCEIQSCVVPPARDSAEPTTPILNVRAVQRETGPSEVPSDS